MKITRDVNGNKILKIESSDIGGARGFSVQTLGNLPKTHKEGVNGDTWRELCAFIREHGTKSQKEKLGVIGDNGKPKSAMNDATAQLIIDSIDCECLEIPEDTEINVKVIALRDCFMTEMGWEVERIGRQKAAQDWLQGLASACTVLFYNDDILNWGVRNGLIKETDTDHVKESFLEKYWERVAGKLCILFNRAEKGVL